MSERGSPAIGTVPPTEYLPGERQHYLRPNRRLFIATMIRRSILGLVAAFVERRRESVERRP
jgi:hypothetical protein